MCCITVCNCGKGCLENLFNCSQVWKIPPGHEGNRTYCELSIHRFGFGFIEKLTLTSPNPRNTPIGLDYTNKHNLTHTNKNKTGVLRLQLCTIQPYFGWLENNRTHKINDTFIYTQMHNHNQTPPPPTTLDQQVSKLYIRNKQKWVIITVLMTSKRSPTKKTSVLN